MWKVRTIICIFLNMKDLFREYTKKHRQFTYGSAIFALMLAVGVNLLIEPGSNMQWMLASVYQAESAAGNISTIDVELKKNGNSLIFHANNPMVSVTSLRAILMHNPDSIQLGKWATSLTGVVLVEKKEWGMTEFTLSFQQPTDISVHTDLVVFPIEKQKSGEPINIVETDFNANSTTYLLTNSGTRL